MLLATSDCVPVVIGVDGTLNFLVALALELLGKLVGCVVPVVSVEEGVTICWGLACDAVLR